MSIIFIINHKKLDVKRNCQKNKILIKFLKKKKFLIRISFYNEDYYKIIKSF